MIVGTTTEEYRFFLVPTGIAEATTTDMLRGVTSARRGRPEAVDVYSANRPGASPGDVLAAVITDQYFRVPAIRLAEARADAPTATWAYEFAWGTPVRGLGACHTLEIGFVFDTIADPATVLVNGPDAPAALAEDMHGRWVAFARDGDPGWPAYDPRRRAVMTFDSPASAVVDDPRADERALWDGIV
jgi:para-nitrobenzyl esterase